MSKLRWGRVAGGVAAIVVVASIVWAVVYFTPVMAVKRIAVEGNAHVSDEEVHNAAGLEEGTPLAQVNLRHTASGVVSLPWVKSATAARSWPSTVKITVEENVPVAFTSQPDGTHLLDSTGKDFAVDAPPEGAVELTGTGLGEEAVRKGAVEIAAALSEPARGEVERVEALSKHDYVLHLREGRKIIWGAAEDSRNKALAVDTVLQREGTEFNITNPHLVTTK